MGAPYFYFTPPSLQQLFDRAPILFLKKRIKLTISNPGFIYSERRKKRMSLKPTVLT